MILFISVAKTGFNLMQRLSKALMFQSPYPRGKIRHTGYKEYWTIIVRLNPLISGAKCDTPDARKTVHHSSVSIPLSAGQNPTLTSHSVKKTGHCVSIPLSAGQNPTSSRLWLSPVTLACLNPLISGAKSDEQTVVQ